MFIAMFELLLSFNSEQEGMEVNKIIIVLPVCSCYSGVEFGREHLCFSVTVLFYLIKLVYFAFFSVVILRLITNVPDTISLL